MAARLEITNSVIDGLLNNAAARREFPFLATYHQQWQTALAADCGSCKRKQKGVAPDYVAVRRSLGQMPNASKLKLRKLLGDRPIKLSYAAPNGKKSIVLLF